MREIDGCRTANALQFCRRAKMMQKHCQRLAIYMKEKNGYRRTANVLHLVQKKEMFAEELLTRPFH